MAGQSPVDDYLAALPADQREALQRVRAEVRSLVPEAVEAISYAIPAFMLGGRGLLWYAGWKSHCSLYPLTDAFLADHADELAGYRRTKGSLHFTTDMPLPDALLRAMIRSRMDDLESGRR